MFKSVIEKRPLKEQASTILADDEASLFPQEVDGFIKDNILSGFIPNSLGGSMGSIEDTLLLGRLLSRRNLTSAIALGQTLLGSLPVWLFGSDEQKMELAAVLKKGGLSCLALTEEVNGSDLMMTGTHDLQGEITGTKWCINNATRGRALCLLAKTSGEVLNVHLILKDKAFTGRYANIEKINTLGIRGADISGIEFTSFKQADSLLGKNGQGLEIILKTMQISRLLCASFSLGAADTTLRRALEFSQTRKLYGKEIKDIPAVNSKLSSSYKKLLLSEAFAVSVTRMVTTHPEVLSLYSAISKYYVTKLSDEIISDSTQVLGARFYIRDSQYGITQKMLRDHRVVSLFDGNSDVNMGIIAGQLKRLTTTTSLKDDLAPIFDVQIKAPAFTGDEKIKLTSRGRDLIWEGIKDFPFSGVYKLHAENLLKERELLNKKIIEAGDNQNLLMLKCVEDYCALTIKANYLIFHHFNHENFVHAIDLNVMLGDTNLELDLSLDQVQRKMLFSHFECEINE